MGLVGDIDMDGTAVGRAEGAGDAPNTTYAVPPIDAELIVARRIMSLLPSLFTSPALQTENPNLSLIDAPNTVKPMGLLEATSGSKSTFANEFSPNKASRP